MNTKNNETNKISDLSPIELKTIKELKGEVVTQKQMCDSFGISRATLLEIWESKPLNEEPMDDKCAGCGGTTTIGYCDNGCDDYPVEEDD